eukprot:11138780-Alexandrium_andersonii.AAC.2
MRLGTHDRPICIVPPSTACSTAPARPDGLQVVPARLLQCPVVPTRHHAGHGRLLGHELDLAQSA